MNAPQSTAQTISQELRDLCQQQGVLPLEMTAEFLLIAVNQENPQRDAQLRFASGRKIRHEYWSDAELEAAFNPAEKSALPPETAGSAQQQKREDRGYYQLDTTHSEPVVRFLDQTLQSAIQRRASDIHFEPSAHGFNVRLRIDGVLQDLKISTAIPATQIAARLKIMAQLDIAERRLPQDGTLRLIHEQRHYPMRISTLPTQYGEKVVLRLQENHQQTLVLEELGLSDAQIHLYLKALNNPQGFILVTGPTGSGKTLTLYSGLQQLNNQQRSICSVEDPIEMPLEGMNQTAINPKIGLTFGQILRALLRQDPDVIMIGEIRDSETAEIAVKAAQTGHLVLSTLHTNSACEALIRLEHMGLQPYLLASSLKLVIAQRLVRLLCPHCKQRLSAESFVTHAAWQGELRAWQATGCKHCFSGYYGRIGVYEMLPITPEIQQQLLCGANLHQLEKLAREQGNLSLVHTGLHLVNQGLTSLEEFHRVLGQA